MCVYKFLVCVDCFVKNLCFNHANISIWYSFYLLLFCWNLIYCSGNPTVFGNLPFHNLMKQTVTDVDNINLVISMATFQHMVSCFNVLQCVCVCCRVCVCVWVCACTCVWTGFWGIHIYIQAINIVVHIGFDGDGAGNHPNKAVTSIY